MYDHILMTLQLDYFMFSPKEKFYCIEVKESKKFIDSKLIRICNFQGGAFVHNNEILDMLTSGFLMMNIQRALVIYSQVV